jgi:peptidoglycan/LPS O-acetylase OafA/YrhL
MTADRSRPTAWCRARAVLVGVVAVVVLSIATDALLFATGVYPSREERMSDGLFVLATAYRIAFVVAGGFLAARMAPDRPMAHSLWVGGVGLAAGIAGSLAADSAGTDLGPGWYPVAVTVIAVPCAWAGGRLHGARMATAAARA